MVKPAVASPIHTPVPHEGEDERDARDAVGDVQTARGGVGQKPGHYP